jgi:tripartite-type tricarboxylate transporter receptor subunit TctC
MSKNGKNPPFSSAKSFASNWNRLGGQFKSYLLIISLSIVCKTSTFAADWPIRPIHAVVPVAAGAGLDSMSRLIFDKLSPVLGQPIVVENRPGAGGIIGASVAAKADPDGYTWFLIHNAHTLAPAINRNLPYDVTRDFIGVTTLGNSPVILVVPPSLQVQNIQDLVKLAKVKPGSLTYAAAGFGTPSHIAGELFRQSAGINVRFVPFKSSPEAATETMTGRIDFFFATIPVALGLIKDRRLIPLAIYGSTRVSALPDVPTTIEAGYQKTDNNFWLGIVVPAKTPDDIVSKINTGIVKILADPELQSKLREVGLEPQTMTVAEFNSFIAREVDEAPAIAKAAGLSENH